MKKLVIIVFILLNGIFCNAQQEVSGIALGLSGFTGIANTSYESYKAAGYSLSIRSVPAKARMFGFSLQLQTGASNASDYYNFIGLGIITRPLSKVYTRFQPYIGVQVGSGLTGYNEEFESDFITNSGDTIQIRANINEDYRIVFSPIAGLEYFVGKKFAFDVAFKYDMYVGSPMIFGKIFQFGINMYPF